MKRDGVCVDGPIARIEPKAIEIKQANGAPVRIERSDLLQVSQGNALVFSARSSWSDVETVHLQPRESFILKLRNARTIQGRPFRITPDSIVFKIGPWMKKRYGKDQIVTVDYLRMKPDSAAFDYFAQEAPAMLFFYPDFYDRLAGLEGKVPVRLYDALQPENDKPPQCARR